MSEYLYSISNRLKKDNFDFDRFIRKLKIQPTALVHCATVVQYIDLIENIYNYKSKSKIVYKKKNIKKRISKKKKTNKKKKNTKKRVK